MEKIIYSQYFHFALAVIAMYLMIIVYRVGYVSRVRELALTINEDKYKQLPGFFKMAWIQIFKYDYLKELFGNEYNDKDYLAD
jgi:hypothetical protein